MLNILFSFLALLSTTGANGGIAGSAAIPGDASVQFGSYSEGPQLPLTVKLLSADNQEVVAERILREESHFEFKNIKPGNYFVSITRADLVEHALSVSVIEDQVLDIGRQYLLAPRKCEGPFTICLGAIREGYVEVFGDSPNRNPNSIDAHLRVTDRSKHPIVTVCEYMKMRAQQPLAYNQGLRVYVIGTLVIMPQGSWLEQKCDDSLKSGNYVWPNAIALSGTKLTVPDSSIIPLIVQREISSFDGVCEQLGLTDKHGNCAVAYGSLLTRDNLVTTTCRNGQTCGYGYGPISAPAQLTNEYIFSPNPSEKQNGKQ